MKFLLIAPFLLAPVFSQFGFVSDIANTVKNAVEDGAKTVQNVAIDGAKIVGDVAVDGANVVANVAVDGANIVANVAVDGANVVANVAVDGAHQVQNAGKTVINQAQVIGNQVGRVGSNIGNHIGEVVNPPPRPPRPASDIQQNKPQKFQHKRKNHHENLQKQQGEIESQSTSISKKQGHQRRNKGDHYKRQYIRPDKRKKYHQNRQPRHQNPQIQQQLQKIRQQIQDKMIQFTQIRMKSRQQGKPIDEQYLQKHKQDMISLHNKMRQIRNGQNKFQQKIQMDVQQERLILKQKIKASQFMNEEEKEKVREEIRMEFDQKRHNNGNDRMRGNQGEGFNRRGPKGERSERPERGERPERRQQEFSIQNSQRKPQEIEIFEESQNQKPQIQQNQPMIPLIQVQSINNRN